MLETLPTYLNVFFIITTVLTVMIFYWALKTSNSEWVNKQSNKILLGLLLWLVIQALISGYGIYSQDHNAMPPKILLFGIAPTILLGIWLFVSKTGKHFIDNLSSEKLTYLHLVRIPVEFGLLSLYLNKAIPVILTFEGWNFDLVMGLTAPLIIYFGFVKNKLSKTVITLWNIIGIFLLSFVVVIAILSSPFPLQQLGFEQPNIGLLYFPYSWLPTFIVPIVILAHLVTLRQLVIKGQNLVD